MGVRMLLNEHVVIERDGSHIFLAGIDDAHFYRVDNIEKAAADIPHDAFSILLSHTPEITGRPPLPGSICCWPGTHTEARSACRAACRLSLDRLSRGQWAEGHGIMARWRVTRRSAPGRAAFPYA